MTVIERYAAELAIAVLTNKSKKTLVELAEKIAELLIHSGDDKDDADSDPCTIDVDKIRTIPYSPGPSPYNPPIVCMYGVIGTEYMPGISRAVVDNEV